ncbi:MAG: dephospho-CoA kinase [Balneolaceae bacterium]|nr:MAG: dephospho-CoA kinase [Balneolaceae bacterium]
MIKVGLTGGIGSGKTTVARQWEKLGARVVYADSLAKELMATDRQLKNQIIDAFGEQSYHHDGSLNRTYLSEQAFGSGRVEELNRLVHPAVYKKTDELMQEAMASGYPVFVKEAALLLKNGRPENLDYIVVVTAPEDVRVRRVAARDNTPESEVRARIRNQQTEQELISFSDHVIVNDRDIMHLEEGARRVFSLLAEL